MQSKIYTNSEPAGGINISYTLSKHSVSQMLDTASLQALFKPHTQRAVFNDNLYNGMEN